ncbi:MAG: metalloregulator ArsR/SmtB family transcription factor [Desulfotomaculum sp.]|nr:metalloregulator ArsR/SmtB family transcription factor [Desulfotomaculum sp.]MCL0080942.1 metalloregulator ArsR/SmtB family transcription factor [Peptococcaceae bacterium]
MPNKKDQQEPVCAVYCVHDQIVKEAKEQMLIPVQAIRLAETFKILGDPNRVQLINILAGREICVCDIAVILGMSTSAVSHQLRLLRNLKLVKYRKEGKMVYYTLDDHHIVNLFEEGLEHIKHT